MSTQYRQGGVTITLTGDIEEWARRAVDAALGDAVHRVEAELQKVADTAEAAWYSAQGVQRQTGQSGQMRVTTMIDVDKHKVIVSVGSADTRTASGIPLPRLIHRAGALATRLKAVSAAEYAAAPPSTRAGRAKRAQRGIAIGDFLIRVRSERASDGKKILPLFVNAPGKQALKAIVPDLARLMAHRIEVTHASK